MNTNFRRWAARIVGTAAVLPTLALGVGAASASTQPATATRVANSTQEATHGWVPVDNKYRHYRATPENTGADVSPMCQPAPWVPGDPDCRPHGPYQQ